VVEALTEELDALKEEVKAKDTLIFDLTKEV
jgi:hypothetical protein